MPSVATEYVVRLSSKSYYRAADSPTRHQREATRFDAYSDAREIADNVSGVISEFDATETTLEKLDRLADNARQEIWQLERAIKVKKYAAQAALAIAKLHNLRGPITRIETIVEILESPVNDI